MTLHNMDTSFNLENFISNLASLARQPFDPEALPDLLEQVTGHRWERSASTSTSAASASVPSASTPHLAAAAVVVAAAAAAAAAGGGDARQEEYKSKTKTDTTNHEDDSLETTAYIRYRARSPSPLLFDLIAIASTHIMGQV